MIRKNTVVISLLVSGAGLFFQFFNQMYKHNLSESVGKYYMEMSPRGFMVYVSLISVI